MTTPQLRPLTFSEIISIAGNLYARSWQTFVPVVLAVVVPVQILTFLILVATVPDPALLGGGTGSTIDSSSISGGEWALFAIGYLVVLILNVVAQALVTAALFRTFSETYVGIQPTWQESLSFAASRLGSVIWVSILVGLVAIVGVIACFVGVLVSALFAMAAFSTAIPIVLVEGLHGTKAMGRSWNLVKPDFWWVLGVLVVAALIVFGGALIIGLITGAIGSAADSVAASSALQAVGNLIVYVLAAPFYAAVVAILYFDLRLKREGLDPATVIQAVRGGAATPPPAPAV